MRRPGMGGQAGRGRHQRGLPCPSARPARRAATPTVPHRTTLGIMGRDGAFADYCCCPRRNLYAVPDVVPDEIAVFAEPLAAACEILEQVTSARPIASSW